MKMVRINPFFKYVTLFSIPYIPIRNFYYFKYFEDDKHNDILYTTRIFYTLGSYAIWYLSIPIYIGYDLQFIEKKIRKIPIEQNDINILFFNNYKIKQTYLEKN
jgi:hypothetical protein